jgi:predicted acetylornithine/succinylornithine family transaminase
MYLLENYSRLPVTVESGEGCYVIDRDGNRYLDAITGIGVNALGYSHPRIMAALTEQAQRCVHTANLVFNEWQEPLAERLCLMSGMDRAFFSNSGTEAMEAALKAVRVHGRSHGANRVVALKQSFHGRTIGSLSITGQPSLRCAFEPFGGEVSFVKANDFAGLLEAVDERTAAVVLEPVLGEGGIYPLNVDFLQAARRATVDVGALLVADEIQCGLGRTGKHFAFQWAGIQPDIVTTAKPLAAGLPLGATLFTEATARCLPLHSHGSTFGGGPLACRVALEFLSIVDELLPRIRGIGSQIGEGLDDLRRRHSCITEVRSRGLMFGIELSRPGHELVREALRRGLLVNCTQETVIRMLPPFVMQEGQVAEMLGILDEALTAFEATIRTDGSSDSGSDVPTDIDRLSRNLSPRTL